MKAYLNHTFNSNDAELISVIDELPLWSAPFGLKLLEKVKMKQGLRFLDVGCGLGFPLVELAQRLGSESTGYGIDPWVPALKRIELKAKVYGINNIILAEGVAEKLPYQDGYFDLIVSNNGINNVADLTKSLNECGRVAKQGAQIIITYNLDGSMVEFYSAFEQILHNNNLTEEVDKMKAHIHHKRRPFEEMSAIIEESGFKIIHSDFDEFNLRFSNAEAMFNHSFIKYWFLGSWKELLKDEDIENVFTQTEELLNSRIKNEEGISLSIPFVTIDCIKQ